MAPKKKPPPRGAGAIITAPGVLCTVLLCCIIPGIKHYMAPPRYPVHHKHTERKIILRERSMGLPGGVSFCGGGGVFGCEVQVVVCCRCGAKIRISSVALQGSVRL